MATVLRCESLDGVNYDFNEWEVADLKEWFDPSVIKLESQLGDPTMFDNGVEHYWAEIDFQIAFASTLANLNFVRLLREQFWLYPHFLNDLTTKYCVILWNPEDVAERWRRGYPLADHKLRLRFREFVGAVCYPPALES